MSLFRKIVSAKHAENEVYIHRIAYARGFAPRIRKINKGTTEWEIVMDDLGSQNTLADLYGTDCEDTPDWIWDEIREMVRVLYEDDEIEYVDVTPYNFLEVDDRIWMIDFGDARFAKTDVELDWYLQEFLYGENNIWNSDFH